MFGTYPREREHIEEPVDDPDDALCRVWDLLGSDHTEWDEIAPELNKCIDAVVAAGFVEEWGHSSTGSLWRISVAGHDRLATLGRE